MTWVEFFRSLHTKSSLFGLISGGSVVSEQEVMMLISVLASPDAPLYCFQSADMATYARSNIRGAQGNRSSPSADKSPTPAESPDPAVQDCQQDAAVTVPGKEQEEGEEKGEGANDDEAEEAGDQQQQGGGDEDECVYASEDEDEGNEQVASSDSSDVGEPEEQNVVETELHVAVVPEAAPDSELPTDPPLTVLEGDAEVSV